MCSDGRRALPVPPLNEVPLTQLLQQIEDIPSAVFLFHIELLDQHIADFSQRSRLLNKLPDSRGYAVQTVIDAVLEAQDKDFVRQVA